MVTRSSVWMVRILVLLALAVAWVLLLMPSDLPASDVWRTALLLVRSGLLLVIPGLAVVLVLRPVRGADMLQTISLAPVVTLSLVPVLLLWTSVWGWRWGLTAVRGAILVGALVVAWKMGSVRATRLGRNVVYGALALGMVFLVALGVRLWVIRGVPYPAGGDSYHHTLITQLIIDGGRVPEGYHPYAPYDGFHYHFGYHAVSAALGWATGLPAHRAVLWGAQVLNALTVPSLFYFVDRVTRDRRAAVIAAAMAAVVCRLPAYYVNWGRYPQMAGQLILPPAVAVTWEVTHRQRGWWRTALLGALLAAGLGLTHYRIAIYYLAALVVLGGALLVVERLRAQRLGRRFLALGLLGVVALGTLAPWLPSLLDKTVSAAQEVAARGEIGQYDYLTLDFVLEMGLSRPVLIVASVAGLWLLLRARRRPLGVLILVWLGLVIFLANPSVSRILPSGFFNNGTVVLSLFLPASLLVGVAAGDILGLLADALAASGERLWQGSLAIDRLVGTALPRGSVGPGVDPRAHSTGCLFSGGVRLLAGGGHRRQRWRVLDTIHHGTPDHGAVPHLRQRGHPRADRRHQHFCSASPGGAHRGGTRRRVARRRRRMTTPPSLSVCMTPRACASTASAEPPDHPSGGKSPSRLYCSGGASLSRIRRSRCPTMYSSTRGSASGRSWRGSASRS